MNQSDEKRIDFFFFFSFLFEILSFYVLLFCICFISCFISIDTPEWVFDGASQCRGGNINVNAARYSSTFNRYTHTHTHTHTQLEIQNTSTSDIQEDFECFFFIYKTRYPRRRARELGDPINVISFHRNNSNRLTNPPSSTSIIPPNTLQ